MFITEIILCSSDALTLLTHVSSLFKKFVFSNTLIVKIIQFMCFQKESEFQVVFLPLEHRSFKLSKYKNDHMTAGSRIFVNLEIWSQFFSFFFNLDYIFRASILPLPPVRFSPQIQPSYRWHSPMRHLEAFAWFLSN